MRIVAAQVIDLGGCQVVPGFIDIHTHGAINICCLVAKITLDKALEIC